MRALLYPHPVLKDKKLCLKAREYLGACYFWLHKEKRMEEEFTALLVKAPGYKLDPFYYPVPLLERFNALRARLQSLGIIPGPAKKTKPRPKPSKHEQHKPKLCKTVIKDVVRHSKILCFIPFGVGQFANGRPAKAAGFLSSQVIGLGLNISAFVAIETLRGDDGLFSPSSARKARILRYVQYAGLGVFAASVLWGVLDALHDFKARQVKTRVIVAPCGAGIGAGVKF